MIQSGGFLDKPLGPLLRTVFPLTKHIMQSFAKSVLILLGLTAAASAAGEEMHKKILGSASTTPIISNDEMEDNIKIVKSLEDSCLLLTRVSKTIQNEAKEQKEGFLSKLLGTLGTGLPGNMLTGKD